MSAEETASLINLFDIDNTGRVNCKQFVYQFFRFGRSERDRHFSKQQNLTYVRQEADAMRKASVKERYGKLVLAKMTTASEEDKKTVYEKIRNAATYFKGDSLFSANLWKSFESSVVSPTAFRELLKSNFDIHLSPGELDAVVKMFDENGDGEISCVEFMTLFFRIGLKERSRLLADKREKDAIIMKEEIERIRIKVQKAKDSVLTRVIWPVLPNEDGETEEDFEYNKGSFMLDPLDVDGMGSSSSSAPMRGTTAPASTSSNPSALSPIHSRISKKPSMSSILSPNKLGMELSKNSGSLTILYPKASTETKVCFLLLFI